MRSVLSVALLCGLLAPVGCGGDEPPPPQAPPPPPPVAPPPPAPPPEPPPPPPAPLKPTPADTLQALFEGLNAHELKKVEAQYAPNVQFMEDGKTMGLAEQRPMMQGMFDAFPDAKVGVWRRFASGNVAIVECVWTGKNDGLFMGKKASGRQFGVADAEIFWFDDAGLIKEQHGYADMPTMAMQLDAKARAGSFRPVMALPGAVETHVARGTPEEEKEVAAARAFDAAFEAGNQPAILKLSTDDSDFTLNYAPAMSKGAAMKRDLGLFFSAFPKQKWAVTNAWGIEDFAIIEHVMTAKQMGMFGPLAPSRKEVTWHTLDILQFAKDGRVSHGWMYADTAEVINQVRPPIVVKQMPPPPPAKGPPPPPAKK